MNKTIFTQAVERNNQRLFLIALSFTQNEEDSNDILQNVFLKLWNNTKLFNDQTHMDKWLTTVCVNECKNLVKSPFRKRVFELDEAREPFFEQKEDLDLIKYVMSLSKKERVVIHLFYYEELSIKEISDLLGIKESAVKTRLHRARNNLKNVIGDDFDV